MTQPGITSNPPGGSRALGSLGARGVSVGALIAGKYRIERVIGQGGMGVVVAATQLQLDRTVAIKLIRPDWSHDPSAVERLLREAKALACLNSEHVARVLDVGTSEDGLPFIVMEYLEGSDLDTVITREGPLPLAEAIDYTLQACEAIAEAHRNHVVHRDLKPANLFVAKQPGGVASIKVVDFGISKLINSRAVDTLTRPSGIVGSLYHMAPEQMRGEPVDARTDVWALGAVLFEMLTGLKPLPENAWPALCSDLLPEPQPDLDLLEACAPADVVEAVRRCLRRSPGDRFANVAELAVVLSVFGTRSARLSLEHIVRLATSTGSLAARELIEGVPRRRTPSAAPRTPAERVPAERPAAERAPAISAVGEASAEPVQAEEAAPESRSDLDTVAPVSDPDEGSRALFGSTPIERRRRLREVFAAAGAGFLVLVLLPVLCVSQTYQSKHEAEPAPGAAMAPAAVAKAIDSPLQRVTPPTALQATAALEPVPPVAREPEHAPEARSAASSSAERSPAQLLPVSATPAKPATASVPAHAAAAPATTPSSAPTAKAALARGSFDIIRTPPDALGSKKPAEGIAARPGPASPAASHATAPNAGTAAPAAPPRAPATVPGGAPASAPNAPKPATPDNATPVEGSKTAAPKRVVDPWNLKDLQFE